MLNLHFHGAAQTTTGSMHIVEWDGHRILLDCGTLQGHRKETFERNRHFPFNLTYISHRNPTFHINLVIYTTSGLHAVREILADD